MRQLGLVSVLLVVACSGSGQDSKPATGAADAGAAAPASAPASKAPKGMVATVQSFVGLSEATPPRRIEVMKALGQGFEVKDGTEKGSLQVIKDGAVLAEVFGDVSGNNIDHVVTTSTEVAFPWDTHVGGRIGDHKHFDRMGCAMGSGRFSGKAVCHAFEDHRFEYVIDLAGASAIPDQAAAGDLRIAAMVWRPKPVKP
jgi:hypothetical protein